MILTYSLIFSPPLKISGCVPACGGYSLDWYCRYNNCGAQGVGLRGNRDLGYQHLTYVYKNSRFKRKSYSTYMYTYSIPQHSFRYTFHQHCLKSSMILWNMVNITGSLWRVCCTIRHMFVKGVLHYKTHVCTMTSAAPLSQWLTNVNTLRSHLLKELPMHALIRTEPSAQ